MPEGEAEASASRTTVRAAANDNAKVGLMTGPSRDAARHPDAAHSCIYLKVKAPPIRIASARSGCARAACFGVLPRSCHQRSVLKFIHKHQSHHSQRHCKIVTKYLETYGQSCAPLPLANDHTYCFSVLKSLPSTRASCHTIWQCL